MSIIACSVDGCDRKTVGKGLCNMHYKRLARHGSTGVVLSPRNSGPKYRTIHKRLVRVRGSASLRSCVKCDEQASDWAYGHADPSEHYDERGRPFSMDMSQYIPLCRQCHCIFDQIGVKR